MTKPKLFFLRILSLGLFFLMLPIVFSEQFTVNSYVNIDWINDSAFYIRSENIERFYRFNTTYSDENATTSFTRNFTTRFETEIMRCSDYLNALNQTGWIVNDYANEKAGRLNMIFMRDIWENKTIECVTERDRYKVDYNDLKLSYEELREEYRIVYTNSSSLTIENQDIKKSRWLVGLVCLLIGGGIVYGFMKKSSSTQEEVREAGFEEG